MNELVFSRFLISTIALSILIMIILLTKKLLNHHISTRWQYNISLLALLSLVIPFLPIPLWNWGNIYSLFENLAFSANTNTVGREAKQNISLENTNWLQDFTYSVERTTSNSWHNWILILWVIGVIVIALLMLIGQLQMLRVRRSMQPINQQAILYLFKYCQENIQLKKSVTLGTSSLVSTPMTFGLIRPYIVLPAKQIHQLSDCDLKYILMHELAHCKHRDILMNYLMCIIQALYWYNPLVWLLLKEMRTDREIICDMAVLKHIDEPSYCDYGHAILNYANLILQRPFFNTSAQFGGSKKQIMKRIEKIAAYSKETNLLKLKSVFVFLVLACFMIGCAPIFSVMAKTENHDDFNGKSVVKEDLTTYFEDMEGCFVLYDLQNDQYHIYNEENSRQRISPNSTYKIYSALLALETGAISKEKNFEMWDGTWNPYSAWNQDQDLSSAMKNSVNWYFQRMDQASGIGKLQSFFNQIDYGNTDLSGGISNYWLESSLKISPIEQVQLLKKFYFNQFQFNENNIATVKEAIQLSNKNEAVLSGKTGTGTIEGKNISGWFIGYVENSGKTYFFATNIRGKDNANGSTAAKITLAILQAKKIY